MNNLLTEITKFTNSGKNLTESLSAFVKHNDSIPDDMKEQLNKEIEKASKDMATATAKANEMMKGL